MTLRTRLVLASVLILTVVALGAVVLAHTQQEYLTTQVDEQLRAARPFLFGPRPTDTGGTGTGFGSGDDERPTPPDTPISDLYVGELRDGVLTTRLEGQLLDDEPDIPADVDADGEPFTVGGQTSSTRFRAVVLRQFGDDARGVIALPLAEVDSTVGRLRWALGGGVAAVAAVLLVAVWWVERLGLRPVARLTAAAETIAGGDRAHRVEVPSTRTEAGKLAEAFNVMLDEQAAGEERLRQFVADASHELRTPLTSIRGYLDLYQEGGFRGDGELDDVVRRMSQESRRMHELVEDLLLLAKLDQHRPLRSERVDLDALLHDAASDARVLQPDRRIEVQVAAPLEVAGDGFRLQQVVGALVTNALVHTPVDASIRLAARPTASGTGAVVTVADDGPGMAPDDAGRAFDRFFRGDRSRGRRAGGSGSGLGLSIARSIVEAHGGTLDLSTGVGRGCRFTITVPG